MSVLLATVLLAASLIVGLVLVPLGLPGLWIMVLGVLGFGWATDFRAVGAGMVGAVVGLAFFGEVVDWWLGFRFARRYGGSRRAGWGALVGGLIGAAAGIPVPIIGSVLGAFVGSFAGAALFEYTLAWEVGPAASAGWGAVLGRAAAASAKLALGLVIAVLAVVAVVETRAP